jgi:hypothetical protein
VNSNQKIISDYVYLVKIKEELFSVLVLTPTSALQQWFIEWHSSFVWPKPHRPATMRIYIFSDRLMP